MEKRTTRTTQKEKEEEILEAGVDLRTGTKWKLAISTSGSPEVTQMAANTVSCNLDQTALEESQSSLYRGCASSGSGGRMLYQEHIVAASEHSEGCAGGRRWVKSS